MRTLILTSSLSLGLFALTACGDKDSDDSGSSTDGASDGSDGTSDGTDGTSDGTDGTSDDGGDGGDAAFTASGTYDGDAFEVDCAFDDSDPDWTAGLQCQDGIQFFAWCRLDPDHAAVGGLQPSEFQVSMFLHTEIASTGTHDVVGGAGLCVGDTMSTPLCTYSQNIESASMTVDAVDGWTSASGSFSAEWNDSGDEWAGDHTATLTGIFDFGCSE
jgi:hypothetical protein